MKKWKKLLMPAMCAFMLQIPVMANAEAVDNNTVTEAPAPTTTPTPAPAPKIQYVKKGSNIYYYKDGVMQKECWNPQKTRYFGKNGAAYAAPKSDICKKNVVIKRIGNKYYGFDRNGYKVKKGVYADTKDKLYYFDKYGVRNAKKSSQLNKACVRRGDAAALRKLLGKPSKTREYSSCLDGISRDVRLTYANIYVMLGRRTAGGEMLYGVQAR